MSRGVHKWEDWDLKFRISMMSHVFNRVRRNCQSTLFDDLSPSISMRQNTALKMLAQLSKATSALSRLTLTPCAEWQASSLHSHLLQLGTIYSLYCQASRQLSAQYGAPASKAPYLITSQSREWLFICTHVCEWSLVICLWKYPSWYQRETSF